VPLQDVAAKLDAAKAAGDWREVLKWEGRMEELMEGKPDEYCSGILSVFSFAHQKELQATGRTDHARSFVALVERRIPLLGKLQRFRDQGEVMCKLSNILRLLKRKSEAATWYQRARDVGAAHGFFSLESKACIGLGKTAIDAGRHAEGLELLRNALVAAELNELDDPMLELDALENIIQALFQARAFDEVEPLVLRYREAAKAYSEGGGFHLAALDSIVYSARLHEVLFLCTPRWEPLLTVAPLLTARPNRICPRVIRAREKTHALLEPCALRRHAGSLKRPRGRCALSST
jgi:tetratricopeptide (TPR) repeat protein